MKSISPPFSATIPGAVITSVDADWIARSTGVNVVRAFDLNSNASLGAIGTGSGNFGCYSNSGTAANLPVIDTAIKPSGSGSLRFDIASQSFPDGQWYANFSPDLSRRFGANSTHYAQWRMRFSQSWIDQMYLDTAGVSQGGIKQMILGAGDTPTRKFGSCSAAHLVLNTLYQLRFPTWYEGCPSESGSQGLYPLVNGVLNYQNKMPSPYCDRNAVIAQGQSGAPPGCFGYVADEFMTAQYGLTLGARNESTLRWDNCRLQFWMARERQPSVLLHDWAAPVGIYHGPAADDEMFGKLWFLPYMTGKSVTQITAPASVWYAEPIISTSRIPDPV